MDGNDYFDYRDCPKIPLDVDDLFEKNQRLQRRICALGRKYAVACKELVEAREALGYYANPLPILQFPREIRDQIFTYALEAPLPVRTSPVLAMHTSMSDFRPPTPGLLLVNRQVYCEAKEILYSRNSFAFSEPQHLLDFLKQIGNHNKDRIQSLSFWVCYIDRQPHIDPNHETGTEPHDWANALIGADLRNVSKLHVQGETINSPWMVPAMEPIMEIAIKSLLQRNPGNEATRKLKLTGYDCNACKRFPQNWEITTKQWDEVDAEESATSGSAEEGQEPGVDSGFP